MLVRYRKFICIFTAVVTVLAGLYLFVLPAVVPSFAQKGIVVSYDITVKELPATITREVGSSIPSISDSGTFFMVNPPTLAAIHKKYPAFANEDTKIENEYAYNAFIQNVIKEKKIAVTKSPLRQQFSLTLTIDEKNLETANGMVHELINTINRMILESVTPQLETALAQLEDSMKALEKSNNAVTAISYQEMSSLHKTLAEQIKNQDYQLTVSPTPFIVNVAQGRAKKLIIVLFAAFFIAVFGAFARNAIENIKKDPEASKTIQDAWKAGK